MYQRYLPEEGIVLFIPPPPFFNPCATWYFSVKFFMSVNQVYNVLVHPFIQNEWKKAKHTSFVVNSLLILVGYIGITFWLNSIRATAAMWFVWVLIAIQLLLYFLIFSYSYMRFKETGYAKLGIIPFIILAVLGRVENWEILIIPLTLVVTFVASARSKLAPESI